MPDYNLARENIWLPFVESLVEESKMKDCILIGHSSGAVAIMRFLERHKVKGAALVSPCYTDLGAFSIIKTASCCLFSKLQQEPTTQNQNS